MRYGRANDDTKRTTYRQDHDETDDGACVHENIYVYKTPRDAAGLCLATNNHNNNAVHGRLCCMQRSCMLGMDCVLHVFPLYSCNQGAAEHKTLLRALFQAK